MGRIGFADYQLSNNNAEIRRLKKRIIEITVVRNSTAINFDNDDFSVAVENGRIHIIYKAGKPSHETREIIKRFAFKWSRYHNAWVRKATSRALADVPSCIESLEKLEQWI